MALLTGAMAFPGVMPVSMVTSTEVPPPLHLEVGTSPPIMTEPDWLYRPGADHPLIAHSPERSLMPRPTVGIAYPWNSSGEWNSTMLGASIDLTESRLAGFRGLATLPNQRSNPFDIRVDPVVVFGMGQANIVKGRLSFQPNNYRGRFEFRFNRPEATFVLHY